MLKISLFIMSLMVLPMCTLNYWWVVTAALVVITPFGLQYINSWYSSFSFFFGMDLMSVMLVVLSFWIAAMMMMASVNIKKVNNYSRSFVIMNLLLLLILVFCFCSPNIMVFYVWFEASLIPTMILIMVWGYQPERMQASMYLMLYTIAASLPMLTVFCLIYFFSFHADMTILMIFPFSFGLSEVVWLMLIGGFLVKLPMFTVHLWLPKAHVEAPIAGSMVLAAVLLKLGGYGIARMLSIFPYINLLGSGLLISISLVGAVITSFICMRQPDLKSLIAYSSVGHMGLMLAGMLSNNLWGMIGGLLMMVAHGLSSSSLFIMANLSYEMVGTRSIYLTKGVLSVAPIMSMWWFLFTAANMAAPPSINLLSEIMLISSVLFNSVGVVVFIGFISFTTAAYSLLMFSSTQHGQLSTFSNPLQLMKGKDYVLLLAHFYPILVFIVKPEIIGSWL